MQIQGWALLHIFDQNTLDDYLLDLLRSNRNFLYLFLERIITNVGDSFYYIAAMWFVYEKTVNIKRLRQ
ncbi:hypothetical protein CYJ36_10555 [Bacillus sp. UMB0893]|nr:hypothetical protein CYJ36_10555 [Bacillus sp. UMB0893]